MSQTFVSAPATQLPSTMLTFISLSSFEGAKDLIDLGASNNLKEIQSSGDDLFDWQINMDMVV